MPDPSTRVLNCASCGQEIHDHYYGVFGRLACERCHGIAQLEWSQASGVGRFLRAAAYGALAGAAGTLGWFAVRAIAHYDFLLLAFGFGLLVGWAVRKGSQGRGGFKYQALAMALTYIAIVSTYVPIVASAVTTGERPAGTAFAVAVIAIAFALPLLNLFQTPMAMVIVLAAMLMAWAMNHRPPPALEGPHPVNPPEPHA